MNKQVLLESRPQNLATECRSNQCCWHDAK